MSLDELIRDELRRSVEMEPLDGDAALDRVRSTRRRGLVRARIARQATAVLVVVSLFAGVAVFLSSGALPDRFRSTAARFRSTATLRVAAPPNTASTSTTIPGQPGFKLADPRTLALAANTRRATLVAAHLAPDDTGVAFHATLNATGDVLTLSATAPSVSESTTVARAWASVFAKLRREAGKRQLAAARIALNARAARLHDQLISVDHELAKLDPVVYGSVRTDDPISGSPIDHPRDPSPPAGASVRELNLANKRIQLIAALADSGQAAARLKIESVQTNVFATVIAQTPAVRVDRTPPATIPALVSWLIVFVLVLGGAVILYRVRVRRLRQDSAYSR